MATVAIIGVVAFLAVVGFVALSGGNRGLFAGMGIAVLALLGGAAWFLLGTTAPRPAPPPAPAAPPPAPVAEAPAPAPRAANGWTAKGRVLRGAAGEEGFAGAEVELFEGSTTHSGPARAKGVVGLDGRFSFPDIAFPAARVRASAPGCVTVAAAVDGEGEVALRLVPGGWAAGRVIDRETKEPLAGARVACGEAAATSGKDGAFRVEGIAAGRAALVATAPGFVRGRKSVAVTSGKGTEDVEIALAPGATVAGRVLDGEGRPVAGALVEVEMMFDAPVVGAVPVPLDLEEIRSGDDGKYRAEGVPAGRKLRLKAATQTALSEDVAAGPVEKGAVQEGVDITLVPGVFVVARVVDGKGAPLQGAAVKVDPADEKDPAAMFGPMMAMPRRQGGGEKITDARGVLRVGPVKAGPVKVVASRRDFRDAEQFLVTAAGVEATVSLTLSAGTAIRGRVQDEAGAPLAGASVTAQHFGGGIPVMENRTTDADGTFVVGGLDGKTYVVRAEKTGYVDVSLNGIAPDGVEVVVTLPAGGVLVGRVTDEAGAPVRNFSVVCKRTDAKSGSNPMDWQRMAGESVGTPFQDEGGNFRVEGLETGVYRVEARAEGRAPGRVEGLEVAAGRETATALVLGEGLTLTGVVVRKGDGSAVAGATVRLPAEGIFGEFDMGMESVDLEGMEAVGGMGPAEGEDAEAAASMRAGMGGLSRASAITGADGSFALRGLEPGSLRLRVSAKGYGPATVRGIEVPAAQPLRIELPEEAAIEGTITDARGAPKPGVMIMLQKLPALMRFATADEKGHYRIDGVAGGPYLFYVMEGEGMMSGNMNFKSETVTLEDGKTLRKDYRTGDGTRVFGNVTRGGRPVGGVMVMLMPASSAGNPMAAMMGGGGGGGGFAMGSTKEDGTFEITGVSPGRYTASVQTGMGGAGAGGGDAFAVARGASEVRHDIVLPEASIHGTVADGAGAPVVGASVMATVPGKDPARATDLGAAIESMGGQVFTDDEGRFEMTSMKPGAYRLQVQAEGFGTEIVDGVAAGVGGAAVRVVLERGLEVKVRVTGPGGTPVRGAAVFLADADGRERTNMAQFDAVRTGEDGSVVVRAPAGTFRFEAVSAGYATGETTAAVPGTEIVIRLVKGAVLNATVTDAGGNPLVGAGVELRDAAGKAYAPRFSMENLSDLMQGGATGTGGVRTWRDLPAGTWTVRAHAGEGRSAEASVTLAEGETKEIVLRVP